MVILLVLLALGLSACGQRVVTTTLPPTLSNDQLGTRAAQTALANFTQAAPVEPSDTPLPDTPTKAAPTETNTALPPTSTKGPTAMPTTDLFAGGQETFRDDFESLAGWFTGTNDNFTVEFLEGGYHMQVDFLTGPDPVYSVRQFSLEDVLVSIDVMRYEGEDGTYFGLICRQVDPSNYYRFVLYTEGEFEIGKKVDGVFTSLVRDELKKPLKTDGSPNNLRAACVGDTLQLYINDELAAEVTDLDLTAGYVGLVAGVDLEPGVDVLFDNFIVSKP
jgi:hypothetical protein